MGANANRKYKEGKLSRKTIEIFLEYRGWNYKNQSSAGVETSKGCVRTSTTTLAAKARLKTTWAWCLMGRRPSDKGYRRD